MRRSAAGGWSAALIGCGALVLRPPLALVRLVAACRRDVVFDVPVAQRLVALTLDDGPDPTLTPLVLDVLERHEARATFFCIGSRAEGQPELLRRICSEGHELGNHLWRDEPTARLPDREFEAQLLRTDAALGAAARPRLFRPGSGFIGRRKVRIAARHGYRCVLASIYPHDAHLRPRTWVIADVLRRVRPGAIVVLHEGAPSRSAILPALDALLAGLRSRGYAVVPAIELLALGERWATPGG